MEWIKSSKCLPDKSGRYLVYHWYQDNIMVLYWDGNKWENDLIITHWKPLPEKPIDATSEYIKSGYGLII